MIREIKDNLRSSLSLINKSKGTLLAFELIYKLAASFVVLPLVIWLITKVSFVSGFKIISTENLLGVIFSPLVIVTFFLLVVVLGAFTILEISFVTLCYTQAENNKAISFGRMIKTALGDSKRVFRVKNLIFVPFFFILIPASNSAIISSLLSGYPTGNFIISRVLSNDKLIMLAVAVLIIAALFILLYSFVFFEYCLYDSSARGAFKGAKKLLKGSKRKMLFVCGINSIIYSLVILFLKELVYIILSIIIFLFSHNTKLYALLLTINTSVKNILDFAVPSMIVICVYSVLCAYYFKLIGEKHMVLPRAFEPRFADNAKRNARIAIFSLVIFLCGVFGYSYMNARADIAGFMGDNTIVMAHRGASKDAPENTIPAFEKAVEMKADFIELDVQETSDGAVVVTHDVNTKRVTGYNEFVWNMTLDEIKQLDAAHYFYGYENVEIPTLSEVFDAVGGKIKFNIELKYNRHTQNLAKSVADIITEYGLENDCVITSSKKEALKDMKEVMPDIPCGYILSVSIGKYYDLDYADFFSLDLNYVTKKSLSNCHKVGKPVNAWTVNDTDSMEKMIALGVDSIITDEPLKARTVITASQDPLSILDYLLKLN